MSKNNDFTEVLAEIVESVNPMQTNADWGREFAQAVFETGDDDLIIYVLSEAGEKYRSGALSALRAKSRRAAVRIASSDNGEKIDATLTQMEFPIVVPGWPPVSLADATHRFLVDACAAAERHIAGAVQNLAMMERARDLSEPWPDESIGTLVASGRIAADALSRSSEQAA